MKNLWWIILVLAYGTWTVFSIIDIINSVKQWIEDNTKIVKVKKPGNEIVVEYEEKKEWTNNYDPSWIYENMEDYSKVWLWTTLVILFSVSLVIWIVSITTKGGN